MNAGETEKEAIHPDEALRLLLLNVPPPKEEILPLQEASGRILVHEVYATVDQPPFDKSAMDGYAHHAIGPTPGGVWHLVEIIAAGGGKGRPLGEGECSLIMTGAPLPDGASAVQRREIAEETGGKVVFTKEETADNIIRRAENQKKGDVLLSPRQLHPQDIGLLSSSGYSSVSVAKRLLVGIISTGDELCPSGAVLEPGKIFDSNGPQLCAQAAALHCDVRFFGIVPDDLFSLSDFIGRSISACDVTIVSGAVSLGNFDFVPSAFASLGLREIFHGLKMRPGKPTYFGLLGDKAVFGLPGNPVSTFVNFEILVKPYLLKRLGVNSSPTFFTLPLASPLKRRGTDRVEYLPARLEKTDPTLSPESATRVRSLAYHGSSMLSAFSEADCLVRMELGVETVPEGGLVNVRLIRP